MKSMLHHTWLHFAQLQIFTRRDFDLLNEIAVTVAHVVLFISFIYSDKITAVQRVRRFVDFTPLGLKVIL